MGNRRLVAALALTLLLLVAACQSTVLPSPGPSVVANPTATPRPTPSPTPQPPAPNAIVAAFLDAVDERPLTMHGIVSGTIEVMAGSDSGRISMDMDMDIRGEDAVGDATLDTGPTSLSFHMLLLDGRAYVDNNGTWTELPDYEQSAPLNPFANVTAADDLEYRRSEERAGQRLHLLKVLVWSGGDLDQLRDQGWRQVRIKSNQTDIYVDDDGIPVSMHFVGRLSGTYQGTSATVDFDMSYELSDVGEPVRIPRP
jgi:hypothetical protein